MIQVWISFHYNRIIHLHTTIENAQSKQSSVSDMALRTSHNGADQCLPFEVFYHNSEMTDKIPQRLKQVALLLVDKFAYNNIPRSMLFSTFSIINSFRQSFSSVEEMYGLLKKPKETLTLRDILLQFYWFFRGVHICNNAIILADRTLGMSQSARSRCKLTKLIQTRTQIDLI